MAGDEIRLEGLSLPRDHAEAYVAMMQAAAAALLFTSEAEVWPGFMAWVEQGNPHELPHVPSELFRAQCTLWARHMMAIADAAAKRVSDDGAREDRQLKREAIAEQEAAHLRDIMGEGWGE